MDATLLTILLLVVFATAIALVQARRRDKCLKSFDGYAVTLAEKGGDLTWGALTVYTTGLEVRYVAPVEARGGHLERSFLFFKEQYEAMDALYRYPEGLSAEEQARRQKVLERTASPGFWRRFGRRLRNWVGMVRDALMQAVGVVIGAAKARQPGSAVLAGQEQQLKALSNEIIGHAGNVFDPMLEDHLFQQVVVEVTRDGQTRSYCGWLKDYTAQFVEVVDAYANPPGRPRVEAAYAPGEAPIEGVLIAIEAGRLVVRNGSDAFLHVAHTEALGWHRTIDCVLPPGHTFDLTLPPDAVSGDVRAHLGTVDRIDMVVPRTHALIRHGADGSEAHRPTREKSVVADLERRGRVGAGKSGSAGEEKG